MLFKKKKPKYPENAKYKLGDFVNFRFRDDLYFGFIYDASVDKVTNKIEYTIQLGGQCPAFVYKIKEETIIGLKIKW